MVRTKMIILSLLLYSIANAANNPRNRENGVVVRFDRVSCAIAGKAVELKLCRVKFVSRDVTNVNGLIVTKKPISTVIFSLKTYYKFSNNEFRPMGIDSGFEYCAMHNSGSTSPLFKFIKGIIANHTNIFEYKCPYPAREYYLKDLQLQVKHLPAILPTGEFLANMTWYGPQDFYVNASLYFSVVNYGLVRWTFGA